MRCAGPECSRWPARSPRRLLDDRSRAVTPSAPPVSPSRLRPADGSGQQRLHSCASRTNERVLTLYSKRARSCFCFIFKLRGHQLSCHGLNFLRKQLEFISKINGRIQHVQFQGPACDSCHPDYLDAQRRLEERDGVLLAARGQSRQWPWGPLPAWLSAAGRISCRQLGRASSLRHFLSEATRSWCLTELNKVAAGSY